MVIKKNHLVKWEVVTRSKEDEDLGIRKARDMNVAFLAKVGWTMETEEENL